MSTKLKINFRSLSVICICLHCFFVFTNPDMYMGIADYYIFLFLYIGMCILSNIVMKRNNQTNTILLMLLYNTIGISIALFNDVFSTGYILSYTMYLLVALLMINMDYDRQEIRQMINAYVISAVIIGLWILIQRYDYYGGGNERHTIRFLNNDAFDPNFLAAYLVFPGMIAFAKMLYRFSLKNMFFCLIIFCGILFTSSRGALLSSFIGITFILLGYFKGNDKVRRILMVLFFLVIGIFVFIKIVPVSSLMRLFDLSSYRDNSNAKRLLDWKAGILAFKESPIIGYGLEGEMSIIHRVLGINYISHNTYIAFLMQLGIVGCIVPIVGFIRLVLAIRHNNVLLGTLFGTLSVSFLVSGEVALFFWMPIIFVLTISKYEIKFGTINSWL